MSVMLCPCIFCVALFVLFITCLTVFCELFVEAIRDVFGCGC